jgi:hypothetical protein
MAFQMYGTQGSDPARHVVRLSGAGTLAEPSRGLWQACVGLRWRPFVDRQTVATRAMCNRRTEKAALLVKMDRIDRNC